MKRKEIKDCSFDEERALYNLVNTDVINVKLAGPKDGESALKETRGCNIINCAFSLRYSFWHAKDFNLVSSTMDELTRAPIWYCDYGTISNCNINSIKALRQCSNVDITNCDITSAEFGWKCNDINCVDTKLVGDYPFLDSNNVTLKNFTLIGKYSLQYMNNLTIEDSYLDTKDAFWHSKNITVKNCVVKGEYLAWFSDHLTLINCKISGTQPFCYCKHLKLINCTMEDCDLSFELSDVDADVVGTIKSVKNIKSGKVVCDGVGKYIKDHTIEPCKGELIIKEK